MNITKTVQRRHRINIFKIKKPALNLWIYMFAPLKWDKSKENTNITNMFYLEGRRHTVKYMDICQWQGLQSQSLCRLNRLNRGTQFNNIWCSCVRCYSPWPIFILQPLCYPYMCPTTRRIRKTEFMFENLFSIFFAL